MSILFMGLAALAGFGIGRISHPKFNTQLAKIASVADTELMAAVAKVKAAAAKMGL